MNLLINKKYKDVIDRTLAFVSLGGTLHGSKFARGIPGCIAASIFNEYRCQKMGQNIRSILARVGAFAAKLLPWPEIKKWHETLVRIGEIASDLEELPEGIKWNRPKFARKKYSESCVPGHIKLFSLGIVVPPDYFTKELNEQTNADDLFLVALGSFLNRYTHFHDTQVELIYSRFSERNGDATDLGILRGDHWSVALPRVLSKSYRDTFPRQEMLKALVLTLAEYFDSAKQVVLI